MGAPQGGRKFGSRTLQLPLGKTGSFQATRQFPSPNTPSSSGIGPSGQGMYCGDGLGCAEAACAVSGRAGKGPPALRHGLPGRLRVPGVMPPERKKATAKDRLEPEAYALAQDREKDALKRLRDEEANEEAREQVRLASRGLEREKQALREQQAALDEKQRDLDKQAAILLSEKKATGQPISPDLEHLGTQAKGRRRPQQQQDE